MINAFAKLSHLVRRTRTRVQRKHYRSRNKTRHSARCRDLYARLSRFEVVEDRHKMSLLLRRARTEAELKAPSITASIKRHCRHRGMFQKAIRLHVNDLQDERTLRPNEHP